MNLHFKQHKKHESDLLAYSSSEGVTGCQCPALVPSHCRPLYSEAILRLGPASDWPPSLCAGPSLVEAVPWSTGCAYHCCINQQWPVTRGLQSNIQTWDINTETSGVMQQNWPETRNPGMMLAFTFSSWMGEHGFKSPTKTTVMMFLFESIQRNSKVKQNKCAFWWKLSLEKRSFLFSKFNLNFSSNFSFSMKVG